MDIEEKREEFEAVWSKKTGWSDMQLKIFRQGEDYGDLATSAAWWAWQASRAAIEIELPESDPMGVQYWKTDVIKSIEYAGLKVKP